MKTITVVTLLTEQKVYCLRELLAAFDALQPPEGCSVRFLIMVAGPLPATAETLLAAFDAAHSERSVRVVERGPAIDQYEGHVYRCSLVAGELRERARLALARRKDAWVLWVDADVLPPPDTLPRMVAHEWSVVSGLVLLRGQGYPICGLDRGDPDEGFVTGGDLTVRPGPQEVGWVGFGLLLVRGDLAREIGFRPYLDGTEPIWTGEDGYWCREARWQGHSVLLDGDLSPWHVDEQPEFCLAVRAEWTPEGTMLRALRLLGETGPHRICLVPRVSGYSHVLGELYAGRPHWTDAAGRELSEDEMRQLVGRSSVLDLAETDRAE